MMDGKLVGCVEMGQAAAEIVSTIDSVVVVYDVW